MWQKSITLLSLLSSLLYAYLGSFRFKKYLGAVITIESIFVIDFILTFCTTKERNGITYDKLAMVMRIYANEGMLVDIIALLPLQFLPLSNQRQNLLQFIKVIRMYRGYKCLDYKLAI
jgi:hypothetical protein